MPQRTIYSQLPTPVLEKVMAGMERDYDRVSTNGRGSLASVHYANQINQIAELLGNRPIKKEVRRG